MDNNILDWVKENIDGEQAQCAVSSIILKYERSKQLKEDKKDYDIVSVISNQTGLPVIGLNHDDIDKHIEAGCKIHSVCYLPTNTVFKIGDKTNNGTIVCFEIFDEAMYVRNENAILISLYNLSHVPKKVSLFTTSDGKEIFEGDEYWFVDTGEFTVHLHKAPKSTPLNQYYFKTAFSTEKSAIEYINEHKPCYSLSEIKSVIVRGVMPNYFSDGEINLVKQNVLNKLKELNR